MSFEALESRQLLAGITVTNATDLISPAADTSSISALIASDGGDGVSLREAITASNNAVGEDTVAFDASVFNGGVASLIRLTQGELLITESLTIDASAATNVTITGDADGDDVTVSGTFITDVAASFGGTSADPDDLLDDNSRVLRFSNDGFFSRFGSLTLNSLTVTGGHTRGVVERGGAISSSSADISLINSNISGNSTLGIGSDGGGISTGSGSVSLLNSTLSGNTTHDFAFSDGGGIYTSSGDVILVSSTLTGNSSGDSGGGGIDTTFGDVSLINSTLSGNIATSGEGGGINSTSGNVSLTNSTLSGNSSLGDGGGIYTFEGNVSLTNSTLIENSSTNGTGGGISVFNYYNSSSVIIENSIVAGNIDNGTAPDLRSDFHNTLTVNHSLISNTTGTEIYSTTGAGNILNRPALLGPLADNGGSTPTHALLSDSPAINAGSNALAADVEGNPIVTDQRGSSFDRIQVGTVDIGAFESNFDSLLPPTIVSVMFDEGGVLARPDLWNTLTIVFDRDVNVVAEDLTLINDSPNGTTVDLTGVGFSYDSSTKTAIWDLSSIDPLIAGVYTYQLDANSIAIGNVTLDGNGDGIRGDDFVAEHYVAIPGDANLDGTVNVLGDAFPLVGSLNSTTNLAWADGNFNGDGVVNVLGDAFILVANLNRNVVLVSDVIVSNATDLVNADTSSAFALLADDGGDGISLREAIAASNNTIGLGTITFDASVFTGGADSLIRLTQGELEITDSLIIDASTATEVVVTGDADGDDAKVTGAFVTDVAASFAGTAGDASDLLDDNSRVLNFSSTSGDLTLTSLTLTGGRTTGDNPTNLSQPNETTYSGGGIRFLSTGTLTIVGGVLSGNSTSGIGASGGAILSFSGDISLTDSTLSGNRTSNDNAKGGGLYTFSGSVSLTNSTLNGNSTSGRDAIGGGIGTRTGNVSLTDSVISGNNTSGNGADGGGIASVSGNISLSNSTINENSTTGRIANGGGISIVPDDGDEFGGDASSGNISLLNSAVTGNSTAGDGSEGGGIRAGRGTVSLIASTVSDNSTSGEDSRGGGISTAAGIISLTNSTVSENSTTGTNADGGGIRTGAGDVSLSNSTLSGNSTSGGGAGGGGIFAMGLSSNFTGNVSLNNSTLNGNSTSGIFSPGGGILISGGSVSVTNSTLSGNSTLGIISSGGGIYSQGGNVSLTNSTLAQNSASNSAAGGISVSGSSPFGPLSINIENSIVADNTDNGTAPDLRLDSSNVVTIDHSLIGDTTGSGITAMTGTGNILNQPAMLGPLADNGGPTLTHALLPDSLAINAGNDAFAVDAEGVALMNDQRGPGFDRIFGSGVDIGAVEVQPGAATGQLQSARASANRSVTASLQLDPSSNADDPDDSSSDSKQTTHHSESLQRVLAGDYGLRDDVFGSDF